MRKITLFLLVCLLILSCFFISCKKDKKETTNDTLTVRLVTDTAGIDDKSFNAAAWRGILSYYGESKENPTSKGDLYDYITVNTSDMFIPTLKNVADAGYDLIVTTGMGFVDPLKEVAPLYPDQKFILVDMDSLTCDNVINYIFGEEEGSYLVGVAAAQQAKADGIENPKFGFIGGVPGSTLTKFEVGYVMGVLSVFPDAQIVDYYANDWGKPELAKTQAKSWYDSGVYCIFAAAGGTGNGALAQAKEYRMMGKNVWAIGVDSDQYEDGLYDNEGHSAVLTSMYKLVENAVLDAFDKIEKGVFKGGTVRLNMADGGVGFAKTNPELKPEVIKIVEGVQKDIIDGKIKVYKTYAEAVAAKAVPNTLHALDD